MQKHVSLRKRRCARYLHAGIVLLLLGTVPAWSQATSTGTVSGQITDQQNAVIGGAEVTLTDVSTNKSQKTTSNEAGRYIFVNVPPGIYDLSVSRQGFSTVKIAAQKVEVGQVLTLNATLPVGSTSTTVEVTTA